MTSYVESTKRGLCAMEIILFVGEQALSLALGFGGGWAYHRYRFLKIKRHAPSAKVASFHVTLTRRDYNRLSKPEDDVLYYTRDSGDPSLSGKPDERSQADSEP